MFVGIDHGTTAMRFAGGEKVYKIPRADAVSFQLSDLLHLTGGEEIEGFAVTYSMGDNFSDITPVAHLKNRGLVRREGAGEHTRRRDLGYLLDQWSGILCGCCDKVCSVVHTEPLT